LVNGPLTTYLVWLETQLQARGGAFFADNRLTVADLKVLVFVGWLRSGRLDHVPTDLVDRVAPALSAYLTRIGQTPAIAQYYARAKKA